VCDTMVRVEPGLVLFAKNSDRDPNEPQLLEWHPAQDHSPGCSVRCTYLEIPQVAHTHAVLLSRPFWMWGAEMGTNEHGVTIGNEAVFTREPYAKTGLTGMDLLRLCLERAADVDEAVRVLTDLLETYGQGGGCGHEDRSFTYHNSFLIADPHGALVLETAGKHWMIEEVVTGARSISNGLTIEPFASRHADRLRTRVSACRHRRARTESAAGAAVGPADLAAALRDHGSRGPGDDLPAYSPINGAMAAPCMHAGGLLAASQTTASWISELTPDGHRHWATATAAPCTSVFKPVRVDTPLDLGPDPTDRFDDATLWWRHERLHRAALRDPATLLPRFAPERDRIERDWFVAPPDPATAFAEADALAERWLADVEVADAPDTRPAYVRRYWQKRDGRARLRVATPA
jgi:secernin